MYVQNSYAKPSVSFSPEELSLVSAASKAAVVEYFGEKMAEILENKHGSSIFDPERLCQLSFNNEKTTSLLQMAAEKGDTVASDILGNEIGPIFFSVFPHKLKEKLSPLAKENSAAAYYLNLLDIAAPSEFPVVDSEEEDCEIHEEPSSQLSAPFHFQEPSSNENSPWIVAHQTSSFSSEPALFVFGNTESFPPNSSFQPAPDISMSEVFEDPVSDQQDES